MFYALDRLWKDCPTVPFVDSAIDPQSPTVVGTGSFSEIGGATGVVDDESLDTDLLGDDTELMDADTDSLGDTAGVDADPDETTVDDSGRGETSINSADLGGVEAGRPDPTDSGPAPEDPSGARPGVVASP